MRAADLPFFAEPFLAFAHRGGAVDPENLHRENTLFAFGAAVEAGFRYLETDVHATSDGVLIAFHDDRLDRVTDMSGMISDLPWNTVREARIGGIDPIPTLAEVLTTFPETRFNIDAKADDTIGALVDHIADYEAWDRVCVSSFGILRLHRLRSRLRRRLGSRRPVASAVSGLGIGWTRFVPVLPRLIHPGGAAFQIPARYELMGAVREIATEQLIQAAHADGQQVHVWTVNAAEEMNRLIDLGVDGLISDRLDTLVGVLSARGLWP